jgi:hypothetical protein
MQLLLHRNSSTIKEGHRQRRVRDRDRDSPATDKERSMFRLLLRISATILIACCVSSSTVFAQESSGSTGEITVTGYGLASAPAQTAALQLVIFSDDFYSSPPQVPIVEATPGASVRTSMEPIVAAIEAHDIVDTVTIVIPTPAGATGRQLPKARLDIAITAPTQDGLVALVNDAARAAGEERLQIGYLAARFGIEDCLSLEQQAREAAMSSAWSQAEIQAAVVGGALGDIVSTVDIDSLASGYYGFGSGPNSNCESPVPMSARASSEFSATFASFDPVTQLPVVEIYREVQVTFAIGGALATPAA